MENAAALAKKFGLESYLGRPAELNAAILNLMLLQETLQLEQTGIMKVNASTISIKRHVHGKFIATCRGDRTYRYAVETALEAATFTVPIFQRSRFISVLQKMGVPDEQIETYCNNLTIDDDTHCSTAV